MNRPLVTVVVATYNMGQYLREAIESVLTQDYTNLEIVVVDDGSTDETQRILEAYQHDGRLRVVWQENAGQTVAKNRGIAEARGEFIAFCDADDHWLPTKLSSQVPAIVAGVGLVYTDHYEIDETGRRKTVAPPPRYEGYVTKHLLIDNFVPFSSVLLPAQVLKDEGGFDPSLRMAIDYELWLRLSVRYRFVRIPEPLIEYRVWSGQMSRRTEERLNQFFWLFERFLENNRGVVSAGDVRRAWAHSLTTKGLWLVSTGRRSDALRSYVSALKYNPFDRRLLKCLGRFVLGM